MIENSQNKSDIKRKLKNQKLDQDLEKNQVKKLKDQIVKRERFITEKQRLIKAVKIKK